MEIKILDSTIERRFVKSINKHLKKGWRIRGNVFKGVDCLNVVLEKD